MSLLIQGGLVVKDGDSQPVIEDILIKGEKVAQIALKIEPPKGCKVRF